MSRLKDIDDLRMEVIRLRIKQNRIGFPAISMTREEMEAELEKHGGMESKK